MPKEKPRFTFSRDCGAVVDAQTGEHLQRLTEDFFKPIIEFAQIVDHAFFTFQVCQTEHGLRWRQKHPHEHLMRSTDL